MPKRYQKKRVFKRKPYRKNHRKQKKNYAASNQLVIYKNPRSNIPYPPRYRTKVTCEFYGYIAAGSASGTYYASMNSVFSPVSGGGWPNSAPSVTTLEPTGLLNILNNALYRQFRVYSSSLSVEFLPQALTDTIEICITPSETTTNPSTTQTALAQPYSKSLFMSSSKMNSKKGSYLSSYMPIHKFVGVSYRAIQDDLSGQFNGTFTADPAKQYYWVVNWATPDAVNTVAALEYRVKWTAYVELFAITLPIVAET